MRIAYNDGNHGRATRSVMISFFVCLLLGINGMIFNQESNADECDSMESALALPKKEVAVVTITIISVDVKIYDPPIVDHHIYTVRNQVTTTFTIDEIIYGNEEFPLESDSLRQINSHATKIGDRYVVEYFTYDDEWEIFTSNCPILEHISFVEFAAFYERLLTNPCDINSHYLIKNSDQEKICVSHDTRDKLIQRGYGFFVPNLFFHEWKHISNNPILDVNSDIYKRYYEKLHCNGAVVSSTGDYCVPYLATLPWIQQCSITAHIVGDYCVPYLITLSLDVKENIIKFNVADMTADSYPFKNSRGDAVFATLVTDKKHYDYGESVTVSGQFSDYVGRWIAFGLELIPIDLENKFNVQIDGYNFGGFKTDELYFVLHDRHSEGLKRIKIAYDMQS